jgi:Predicted transcriptional regulator
MERRCNPSRTSRGDRAYPSAISSRCCSGSSGRGFSTRGADRRAATVSPRPADQITVGALLRAVEGRPGVGAAGRPSRGATGDAGGDLTYLWRAVSDAVDAVVDGTTLEDLKRHAAERRASAKPMYHI